MINCLGIQDLISHVSSFKRIDISKIFTSSKNTLTIIKRTGSDGIDLVDMRYISIFIIGSLD